MTGAGAQPSHRYPQTWKRKGGRTMSQSNTHGRTTLLRALVTTTGAATIAAAALVAPAAQATAPTAGAHAASAESSSAVASAVRVAAHAPTASGIRADVLAASTGCTTSGLPSGVDVSCELWAKSGSVTLPGASSASTVWTFVSLEGDAVTAPVGPTLVVTAGQTVQMVLHNRIDGESISLSLPQVDQFDDDLAGVASGSDATYSFSASRPGTFLYEAGGTVDGTRQVAMGLVGALVVLPSGTGTAGTVYGTSATAYTDEGVLVMSDVDPALNANPSTFDMRNFSPRYHLFNGLAYPNTQPIPVGAGGTTLLRVVNAGIVQHAIGVLGSTETVVGVAARPLSHPYTVAAENVSAGDTLDALVTVPSGPGLKYAVLDPSFRLDNDGQASSAASGNIVGLGGQLTFLQASGTAPDPAAAPTVTNLVVTPTRVGTTPTTVSFSATVTDDVQVTGAEYILDNTSVAPGSGNPVTVSSPAASVSLSNVSVDVSALATGSHQLMVRGRDASGWGPLASVSFAVDKSGPTVSGLTPKATAVNGSGALDFTGSATDVGGGKVSSATWALDGSGTDTLAISPSGGAATVSLSGSVPAATMTGLAEGNHTLTATAKDDQGNVGPAGPTPAASFLVDRTAPTIGTVTVSPSPNDGTQGIGYDATSIEVRATFSDPSTASAPASGVASGEGFLTTAGSPGTGFPMVLSTSTTPATLVATVPLSQINSLPEGNNPVWVRAKDKAGNWGDPVSGTLVIQRGVTVSGVSLTPPSTDFTTALAGTATATPGATIVAVEYFVDTDPGLGSGGAATITTPNALSTAFTATIPTAAIAANVNVGAHTVYVRAKASTGKWSTAVSVPLTTTMLFSDGFEATTLPGPWAAGSPTNASGGTASSSTAAALTGSRGLLVAVTSGGPNTRAFVTTPTTTAVPTYHVRFQLRPDTFATGNNNNRWVTVERAMNGATEVFRIEYQKSTTGTARVRAIISRSGGTTTLGPVNLQAGSTATNTIRLDWTASGTANVRLTANTTTTGNVSLNTSGRAVTSSQFGISLANGSFAGGNLHLDAFDSAFYLLP